MRDNDFVIGSFKGLSNGVTLIEWEEPNFPMRKTVLNSELPMVDRALILDNKNYSNREFKMKFMIKSKNMTDYNAKYSAFMKAIDTGRYVTGVFYFDEDYEYQLLLQGVQRISETNLVSNMNVFEVTFTGAPFKRLRNVATVNVGSSTLTLTNPTLFDAKPHIKLVGSGDIRLFVNDREYLFVNVTGNIELDCALQTVYRMDAGRAVNENNKMRIGPFPIFKPGANKISVTGGTAIVTPKWRTV